MEAERDAGHPGQLVQHVRALAEHPVDGDAGLLPRVPLGQVDQLAEVGRVDLDVAAAHPRQLLGFLLHQPQAVGEHLERVGVGVP
jgi:hypothetical protein